MILLWLVMLCLFATFTARAQDVAASQWSHEYQTQSTRDIATSVVLDEEQSTAFIVGRAKGPRGMNVSFEGLAGDIAGSMFDNSKTFQDATIAKIQLRDRQVIWAKRLSNIRDTSFSAVALSKDKQTVFAAGMIYAGEDNHPFILQAFDSETGQEIGALFQSATFGKHIIRSMVANEHGLFVCGKTSRKNGLPFDRSKARVGGIMVAKMSIEGELVWLKQGGHELKTDYCSSIKLSEYDDTLFITGTSHRKSESGVILGMASVYALSTYDGSIQWMQQLPFSTHSELRSSDILAHGDAIYVSTSFWSQGLTRRTIIMHKLSRAHGTLLWSEETCCKAVQDSDTQIEEFEGKGSGEPVYGLAMGADRYVYHLGYYRRVQELVQDRHATVVVRIGEYGEHVAERDVSRPVETFKIIPSEPKRAVFSLPSQLIYILSNNRFISAEDVDMSVPKLDLIKFNESESIVISKAKEGTYSAEVIFRVTVKSVSIHAVSDVVAEKLRLAHKQMNVISRQTPNSLSEESEARFKLKVFGSLPDSLLIGIEKEIMDLFKGNGESNRNVVERHFGLKEGCVQLVEGSVQGVDRGGANGGGNLSGAKDDADEEGNSNLRTFALIGGGLVGLITLVAGVVLFWKGRQNMEESFAEPALNGRPGSECEVSYVAAY